MSQGNTPVGETNLNFTEREKQIVATATLPTMAIPPNSHAMTPQDIRFNLMLDNMMENFRQALADLTTEVINLALAQEKAKMVKKVDGLQQQQEKDGSTTIDNNKLPLRMIQNNEHHNKEVINSAKLTTIPPRELENNKHRPKEIINTVPLSSPSTSIKNNEHQHEEVTNLLSLDTPTKTLIKDEQNTIKQTNEIQLIIPPPHGSVQFQSEPTSTLTLIKDEQDTIKQTNGIQLIIPPPHVSVQFQSEAESTLNLIRGKLNNRHQTKTVDNITDPPPLRQYKEVHSLSRMIDNHIYQPKEVVSNFTSLPPPHIKKT
ncbi:unnamed protein product [Ambrosiozyma monospora]|uniref:Unnamed protein product n=1 Tax=Ambrosiozyma monospora TaxID=43982 RepID=A0A9W7DLP3_AMBMO|nr:unnamed protein product [Ambrosiozyma monospora]